MSQRIQHFQDWLRMPMIPELGFDPLRTPYILGSHVHQCFELTYVSTGNVTWELQGYSLQLVGGAFALTQPNVRHQGEWNVITPCDLFWFHIDLDQPPVHTVFDATDITRMHSVFTSFGNQVGRGSPELQRLFAEWEVKIRASDRAGVAESRALLCQILAHLTELMAMGAVEKQSSAVAVLMERYLQNHLTVDVSLAEVAAAVGLSQRSAIKHFKQDFGQTPMDYLRRLRCQKAAELLRLTKRSVTDIAFSLGFRSSQNFAKVFRRYTNMTPTGYRRSVISDQ